MRGGIECFAHRQMALLASLPGVSVSLGGGLDPRADVTIIHKCRSAAVWDDLPERCIVAVHDHEVFCPRTTAYTPVLATCLRRCRAWRCLPCSMVSAHPLGRLLGYRAGSARRRAVRQAKAVVVLSGFMRSRLAANGVPEASIRVIPPPIEPAEPVRVAANERFLYLGQLIRGKGVDSLLRALAEGANQFPLEVVGNGNRRVHLERTSRRLNLSGRVRFHGWQEAPEPFFHNARALVAPSFWAEPYGLVVAEAAAHAVPAIVADHGGLPQILPPGAVVTVPPRDDQALAAALDRLATRPQEAKTIGLNAREHIRRHNAPECVLEQWRTLIDEVCA